MLLAWSLGTLVARHTFTIHSTQHTQVYYTINRCTVTRRAPMCDEAGSLGSGRILQASVVRSNVFAMQLGRFAPLTCPLPRLLRGARSQWRARVGLRGGATRGPRCRGTPRRGAGPRRRLHQETTTRARTRTRRSRSCGTSWVRRVRGLSKAARNFDRLGTRLVSQLLGQKHHAHLA